MRQQEGAEGPELRASSPLRTKLLAPPRPTGPMSGGCSMECRGRSPLIDSVMLDPFEIPSTLPPTSPTPRVDFQRRESEAWSETQSLSSSLVLHTVHPTTNTSLCSWLFVLLHIHHPRLQLLLHCRCCCSHSGKGQGLGVLLLLA